MSYSPATERLQMTIVPPLPSDSDGNYASKNLAHNRDKENVMNRAARACNIKTLVIVSLTLMLSTGYFCNGQSPKAALDTARPAETIQFVGYAEGYDPQTGLRIHVHDVLAGSLDQVVVDVKTPGIGHAPIKGGLIEVTAQRDNATGILTATKAAWVKPNDIKATITFVGKVLAVGESSGGWSGFIPSFQQVTYEVKQVVKGDYSKKRITISHLLTQGSPECVSQPKPSLNPAIFHTDACLEIFAEYRPGKATDEFSGCWLPRNITAVPNSDPAIQQ